MVVPPLRVNVKGVDIILRRLRNFEPAVSVAQQETGQKLGRQLRAEARRIIKSKAPKSSGNLYGAIDVRQAKVQKGWNTTIFVKENAAYYAKEVESGGPPKPKTVSGKLLNWVERVLGDSAAAKLENRIMHVRTQRNPHYDTAIGMQFFQIPFARHQGIVTEEYDTAVNKALRKAGLK